MKFLVKIFDFLDNYIWIGYAKFSPEWKKYFSSTVNVLTNIMKISDLNRGIFADSIHSWLMNQKIKLLLRKF